MHLLHSIFTISCVTFFSRIFGFLRDLLLIKTLGAGISSDAFLIAFKLPNLLRNIFAEGAFSQSFIPILTKYKYSFNKNKIKNFISYTFGLLIFILIILVFFGCYFSKYLVFLVAPGFLNNKEKIEITSIILSIIFPYILLISISSFFSSILNVWNIFLVPSFSPFFLNITMILFLLFLTPYFKIPVIGLSYAVLLGGIFQAIYQIPFLKKIDINPYPKLKINNMGILQVIYNMSKATIGGLINQLSLIINTIFCSFLVSGSISWIYYASRLIELPIGILGVTINTILLPLLSKNYLNKQYVIYNKLIDWGLRFFIFLCLPISAGLAILADSLVILLFQYGKFTLFDSYMTQQALLAYSLGLVSFILVKFFTLVFFSIQDIKTPIKISIFCFFITQIFNIIFVNFLQHVGLVLAFSLSSILNAAILYFILIKKKIFLPEKKWKIFLFRIFTSVIFMSILLILIKKTFFPYFYKKFLFKFLSLFLLFLIGTISYFLVLFITGFKVKNFLVKKII